MLRLILLLLTLILAVWLGLQLNDHPGYLLIAYGQWTIETPLWLGLTVIVLVFLLLHSIWRFLKLGGSVSGRVRQWTSKRKLRYAQNRTSKGLIDLSEGYWRRAEKNLIKAADDGDVPLINYLAAAKAAQEQGAYQRRDDYLRKAHHVNPDAKIAVELTQAQLQIHHRQLEQALATLRHLSELAPKHAYVIKLLKTLYVELKDWHSLEKLLPAIKKLNIVTDANFQALERTVYENLLMEHKQRKPEHTQDFWQSIPKHLKSEVNLLLPYCQFLNEQGHGVLAEKLIRQFLKKNWHKPLVALYGTLTNIDHKQQLSQAEQWLKKYPNDAELLLCLGKICQLNQLWGKARSYLESSISLCPSQMAYGELGQLFEQMDEKTDALHCYRQALFSTGR